MKISKKAEYGLMAMVHLAKSKNKKAISIREIAKYEAIPFEFLGKIFSSLEKAKLVTAKHGIAGGYYLAKPASKITAGDIVEVLDGKITPMGCALCSRANKCVSKSVWDKVRKSLTNTLYSIKLSSLIK